MKTTMAAVNPTRALIDRAKEGNEDAFQELVERYEGQIVRLIRSRLGKRLERQIDVADVVQESFLRAFQAIASFTWQDDDSFIKWLTRIATNYLREVARREKRRVIVPLENEIPSKGVTESRAHRREERFDRFQAALDRLSPDHREVILLARVERLPVKEVARRMGRTATATSQLLWRAMQNLKDEFGDTESLNLPDRRFERRGGNHAE